jgi:Protein of unknown function (DUF3383)
MAKLPYSRVVNVTLTRNDAFPTRRGFGVALLLTNEVSTGEGPDATFRTKMYASMDEVEVDYAPATETYKGALAAFSQNPRPLQIKVGYVAVTLPGTAAGLQGELDLLYDYDSDWYWIGIIAPFRDIAALDGLVNWIEAKNKMCILDSNDPNTELLNDLTSLAGRHQGTVERTAVFYHTDPEEYAGYALAAYLGTFNFDQADAAYTAKFKRLKSVTPLDKGSAIIQIVSGFVPEMGQSSAAGHMANTYIDIGDRDFVVEGSTLTPNVFIDEIHATDWIIARTEEETLGVLLNNKRVPYTDVGMETLASGARTVMRQADRAGLIANDLDPETGLYLPAVEFLIPSVFDVPESQRVARIAPDIRVNFRYAGAVHYTTIHYRMTF